MLAQEKFFFSDPDSPTTIIWDESGGLEIRGAVKAKLIEKLCHEVYYDFLLTFPYFMKAEDVLRYVNLCVVAKSAGAPLLDERAATVKRKIIMLLRLWLDGFPADLQGSRASIIQEMVLAICETQSRGSKELMAAWKDAQAGVRKHLAPSKVPETLWRKAALLSQPSRRTLNVAPPLSPASSEKTSSNRIIDFMPEEVARQIALAEHKAFVSIDVREFLRQVHNKPDAKTRAPNLTAFIARFEKLSKSVQTDILRTADLRERGNQLSMWIEVAEHMRTHNNYHGLVSVMAALLSSNISRLVKTWGQLSFQRMQAFTELDRLAKRSANWKELRSALDTAQGACLPYLGYFFSDLALLEEGAPDELVGGLMNFAKWRQAARVLGKIHEWQGRVYAFAPVEGLQKAISLLEAIESDDALYALSLQREERGTEAPSQAEQMKRETLDRLAGLKETIDRKTQRYKSKTGIGLDVVYVEDRLLSMGFPSSFQIKKLASFLLSTHKDYRVYNFCEEETYEQKKFAEVISYPFAKHSPPPFVLIDTFISNLRGLYEGNGAPVAAVHCKSARDRSGLMMACWLIASGKCLSASHAIQFINGRLGAEINYTPSQLRYISYIEERLKEPPSTKPLLLKCIRMHTVPAFDRKGGCEPFFSVGRTGRQIFRTKSVQDSHGDDVVEFDCTSQVIAGDVTVAYYHKKISVPMFSLTFNTAFVQSHKLKLVKRDVDGASDDARHFHKDFKIELVFDMPRRQKRKTVRLEQLVEAAPYEEALRGFCSRNGLAPQYQLYTDTHAFARLPPAAQEQLNVEAVKLLEKHRQQLAEQEAKNIEASISQKAAHPQMFLAQERKAQAELESKVLPKFVISTAHIGCLPRYTNVAEPEPGASPADHALPVEESTPIGTCAQCFKDIRGDDATIALGEYRYHWVCVTCIKCGRPLDATNCLVEGDKAMCARCEVSFFALCSGCGDLIVSNDFEQLPAGPGQVMHWHRKCWKCDSCGRVAGLELRSNRLYCPKHVASAPTASLTEPPKVDYLPADLAEMTSHRRRSCDEVEEDDGPDEEAASPSPSPSPYPIPTLLAKAVSLPLFAASAPSILLPPPPISAPPPLPVPSPTPSPKAAPPKSPLPTPPTTPSSSGRTASSPALVPPEVKVNLPLWRIQPGEPPLFCTACKTQLSGVYVKAASAPYHPNCLRCTHCAQVITETFAAAAGGAVYCPTHSYFASNSVCPRCGEPVLPGQEIVEVADREIHKRCFKCALCEVSLTRFKTLYGKQYCGNCNPPASAPPSVHTVPRRPGSTGSSSGQPSPPSSTSPSPRVASGRSSADGQVLADFITKIRTMVAQLRSRVNTENDDKEILKLIVAFKQCKEKLEQVSLPGLPKYAIDPSRLPPDRIMRGRAVAHSLLNFVEEAMVVASARREEKDKIPSLLFEAVIHVLEL